MVTHLLECHLKSINIDNWLKFIISLKDKAKRRDNLRLLLISPKSNSLILLVLVRLAIPFIWQDISNQLCEYAYFK